MKFHLLHIFAALLCVVNVAATNAPLLAEIYWHSKLPNTPTPKELHDLLLPDMGDEFTLWNMGVLDKKYTNNENKEQKIESTDDKREKYGKRYENPFKEGTDDKREKYGKRYENAFKEGTEDKREKYGKRYENAFKEGTEDKREKYGKRYENAFQEGTDDKREKYEKRYENAFEEGTEDKREKYGKRYENAFKESTNDKREKYGKRYENAFEDGTEDKREKYGKRYENAFKEGTDDKREKYGKRYENAFEEGKDDRREKYGKRYENAFEYKYKLPNSTIFFEYKDLDVGKKMRVHITKSTNKARILPRQVVESMPFSSDKLSNILKNFSIDAKSPQAKLIKQTIADCESPGIKEEDRYCPRSLESLVDFSIKHVGNNVQILMNEVDKPKMIQEYTIVDIKLNGEEHVVCHKQKYPYAVYYCHELKGTKVYTSQLLGADGTKAKAIVVCHSNTSNWNPRHLAFLLLNMKPGEGTVCHFIRSDTFVVVSTPNPIA